MEKDSTITTSALMGFRMANTEDNSSKIRILNTVSLSKYTVKTPPIISPDTPLLEVAKTMNKENTTHVLIGYSIDEIEGVISLRRLLSLIVKEPDAFPVLEARVFSGVKPVEVNVNKSLVNATRTMIENNVFFLLVVDDNKRRVGSVFERDILRGISENIRIDTRIEEHMEKFYPCLAEGSNVRDALIAMSKARDRYLSLPIIRKTANGRIDVIGVFSAIKVLSMLVSTSSDKISEILNYNVSEASYADVITVHPGLTSNAALDLLLKYNLRLLIIHDEKEARGVVTPRAFLRAIHSNTK